MDPKKRPGKEEVAKVSPEIPMPTAGDSGAPPLDEPAAFPEGGAPPGSPLGDYLLELEQEYQDQEEEGKL
jgi:hypothetical protein